MTREDILSESNPFLKLWNEMVLFGNHPDFKIDKTKNVMGLEGWAFKNLMRSTERVLSKWGIKTDKRMIQMIEQEKNIKAKAAFERAYILDFVERVRYHAQKGPRESPKWDSWPAAMFQTGRFNCVGGALLGLYMIGKISDRPELGGHGTLSIYVGKMTDHVVNIVKLSDDEWFLVDPRRHCFRQIFGNGHIEVNELGAIDIRELKEGWSFSLLLSPTEIIHPILMNIDMIRRIGELPDWKDGIGIRRCDFDEARRIYGERYYLLEGFDIEKFADDFFPEIAEVQKTIDYKKEKEKVKQFRESLPQTPFF